MRRSYLNHMESLESKESWVCRSFFAALPNFVKDHLVMEQWYTQMGSLKSGSRVLENFVHLPGFAVNNLETDASGHALRFDGGGRWSELLIVPVRSRPDEPNSSAQHLPERLAWSATVEFRLLV